YHQPVTRAEIEDIRGVAVAKGTVDTLLEAGWIKPRGRKQTPGRPLMWGTTDAFLDHFGLSTVKELPGMDELKAAGLLDKREGLASLPTSEDDNDDETETELEMEDGEETGDAGTSADVIQLDQAR
ncbi:MAG: SMC-Scp complex subunit ScpB, partial [Alphaproteobacteria bacterium]